MNRKERKVAVRLFRLHGDEDGAVMVEFIIVMPIFFFLIAGTIQFMGIAHADALLQYANFMAVRAGTVHYESIMEGWDPSRSSGDPNDQLTAVMTDAAVHALAPIYRTQDEQSDTSLPPYISPVLIKQVSNDDRSVRVQWGALNMASETPYLPVWLYAWTEIDLGLGVPYAGAVIEGVYRTLDAPELPEAGSLDLLAPRGDFSTVRKSGYPFPYIVMRSDTTLDLRDSTYGPGGTMNPNWIPWPVTELNDSEAYRYAAQPTFLPVQSRFR